MRLTIQETSSSFQKSSQAVGIQMTGCWPLLPEHTDATVRHFLIDPKSMIAIGDKDQKGTRVDFRRCVARHRAAPSALGSERSVASYRLTEQSPRIGASNAEAWAVNWACDR